MSGGDTHHGAPDTLIRVAEGAVLGALCGDAAGAVLEGFSERPTRDEVERAVSMVGDERRNLASGQITDDGEMTLCLMHALDGAEVFDVERVAEWYLWWLNSKPFSLGGTTYRGLKAGAGRPRGAIHRAMWKAAQTENRDSKANGSLMRIVPLGVWGYRMSEDELVQAARDDSRLTHSNYACQIACAVYCSALRHLMRNPGDSTGAVEIAIDCSRKLGNPEVIEWLDDAVTGLDPGYSPLIGFVKYGFSHAFRHLSKRTPYPDAIAETLSGGGDTDTNACIVGGMIGALHGVEAIPERMKHAVLTCDTSEGRPRPEPLQTRLQLPAAIHALLAEGL